MTALTIHPYPAALESEVVLRDGTRVAIRPIRPEDAELALVALFAGEFIAVGRYAPNADDTAEFALVVTDAWQAKGLGRILLTKLRDEARKTGYKALYGNIMAENRDMLDLARSLGFVQHSREGSEVTVVSNL